MTLNYGMSAILALTLMASASAEVFGAENLGDALRDGKPILNMRLRYENVDQDGIPREAHALTLRTRFGYQTDVYRGFSALLEGENVVAIGTERFNDTINRRTQFPVVADPDAIELNQGYLNFAEIFGTDFRGGRQRILLDNQRFVGAVGFRQNEQTFDAVSLVNRLIPNTTARYIYVWHVHRIFGDDSPVGDFRSQSHLANVAHELSVGGVPIGRLVGYAYAIELKEAQRLSSVSAGLRLSGTWPKESELAFVYAAEFAHQWDHAENPLDYDANYYLIEPGLRWRDLTARFGYEVLGGNGPGAFQTPLATLHAFNGVTDKFLITPAAGIEDIYVKLRYDLGDLVPLPGAALSAAYHDFSAEDGGADYGSEWGVKLLLKLTSQFSLSAEFADYDTDGFATDTQKAWITLQFVY
jgi:hypothetical protein